MVLPVRLPTPDRSRTALRRHRPRAGRPRPRPLRRARDRPRRRRHRQGADTAQLPRPGPARPTPRPTRNGSVPSTTGSTPTTSGCTTTARTAVSRDARTASLGLLGRPAHRPRPVRLPSSGDGSRLRPDRRHVVGDRGGSSLAAILAVGAPGAGATAHPYAYTWKQALAATSAGTLRPLRAVPASESETGIPDPRHNVTPVPDYTRVCSASGLDNSPACIAAVLAAVNHAHALEGVRPMVLPSGFARLSVPDQLFVAVNLERVDRGLPPFGGLTTALDRNAQVGADDANDPPDPGAGVRPRRRGVGRRVRQRPRRRLRVDVRRRVRQRQPGLPASRRSGLLGPPQGHPRRLRLRGQPGHGRRGRHDGRHPQG